MILNISVLFICAFLGGVLGRFAGIKQQNLKMPLIFAGSYLFSITVIHILPEIFSFSEEPMKIGLFVLMGFFLQQILEYFSSGIEHGHVHKHQHISGTASWSIVIALVIHSLLEGALLTHESPLHGAHESNSLLLGILFHKVPAAFALMTTLQSSTSSKAQQWVILIIFSLSSPAGLVLSEYLLQVSPGHMVLLFGVVSGSFLHISTTIFVESSPNHHFGFRKILISLAGAAVAILSEMFF